MITTIFHIVILLLLYTRFLNIAAELINDDILCSEVDDVGNSSSNWTTLTVGSLIIFIITSCIAITSLSIHYIRKKNQNLISKNYTSITDTSLSAFIEGSEDVSSVSLSVIKENNLDATDTDSDISALLRFSQSNNYFLSQPIKLAIGLVCSIISVSFLLVFILTLRFSVPSMSSPSKICNKATSQSSSPSQTFISSSSSISTNLVPSSSQIQYSLSSSFISIPPTLCPLTANTSYNGIVINGCNRIQMDTSSCQAQRIAAGLTGAWLEFSCRVSLTLSGTNVIVSFDSRPNYQSNFFPVTDPCWKSYNPVKPIPNRISTQNILMTISLVPTSSLTAMRLGVIGSALNAVAIFDNTAAPGMDIYEEHLTFDQCAGHPTPNSVYHYHCEPFALSYNDSNLIGVLRDGYFVYGRYDFDGSVPALDAYGGHTSVTPYSNGLPVYHYHTNMQTSITPGTVNVTAWFLSTGIYKGSTGVCSGCN